MVRANAYCRTHPIMVFNAPSDNRMRRTHMTFKKHLAAAAATLALLACAPAFAADVSPETRIVVSYADLDISRRAGAEALVVRLRQAAKQVCGEAPNISDLRSDVRYRACLKASMTRAIASVAQPVVTQAYENKFGNVQRVAGN